MIANGSPRKGSLSGRERDQWVIKQALDTGVYGLVLPHLNTVEDAQAAVAAARYPQVPGVQDIAPGRRARLGQSHRLPILGPDPDGILRRRRPVAADPDGNILLMGIIEEAEGVRNIRGILRQVRGIDAIWAGSGDMSVSMGFRGQASHPAA